MMCTPSDVPSGSGLGSVLASRAGFALVAVGGSVAFLSAATGGTLVAWVLAGVSTYAALATIALLTIAARPTRRVQVPAAPARRPVRVVRSRTAPALTAADPATQPVEAQETTWA